MKSKTTLLLQFVIAICFAVGLRPAFAQENVPSRKPKVTSYGLAANVNELYIAIMGEVAKPGTYHLDSSSLKLHAVVQRAGGFTGDASTTIRIIRNGRTSHKEVFSERVNCPLMPGDLLIVDSKQSNPGVSRNLESGPEPTTIHASYQVRPVQSGVQIALLNVLDYPVVLNLRGEEANASNIVERLGQPIGTLAKVDVITPDVFPRSFSEQAKNAIRLMSGSVMVFEKGRVDRARLPGTLPRPIESEIAQGAQSSLIGGSQGQSAELRNLGQRAMSPGAASLDPSTLFTEKEVTEPIQSLLPEPAHTSEVAPVEATPSVGRTGPRIASLPFTGSPQFRTSSSTTRSMETPDDLIPQPDDVADQNEEPAAEIPVSDAGAAQPKMFSIVQLLVIFLVVGALVGAAIMLRYALETRPQFELKVVSPIVEIPAAVAVTTPPSISHETTTKSLLERLIKNELPMTIESIEFPAGLTLQGRIAPRPILRVDGAQSILKQAGPHFEGTGRATGEPTLQDVIAQLDSAGSSAVRRPHFMSDAQQPAATSSKIAGDWRESNSASTGDGPKAPLAKALFELEQGGRS